MQGKCFADDSGCMLCPYTHTYIVTLPSSIDFTYTYTSQRWYIYIKPVFWMPYMRHTEIHVSITYMHSHLCLLTCQMAVALRSIQPQGSCLLDKTWHNNFYFLLKTFFLSHVPILLNPRTFGKVFLWGGGVIFLLLDGEITPNFILVFVF